MTAIVMEDNFVCTVQAYFLATIMCRAYKMKYNYYLLAYEQSERIRDVRHDMRNQLQIMQNLMETGGKEGKERAQGMLMKLEKELER